MKKEYEVECDGIVLRVIYDGEEGTYTVIYGDGSTEVLNPHEFRMYVEEWRNAGCHMYEVV